MADFTDVKKIPKTIFKGMPTDKLAPTDPTKISDVVKPINNYKRNLIEGLEELKTAIPSLKDMENISDKTKKALDDLDKKLNVSKVFDKLGSISKEVERNLNIIKSINADNAISILGNTFNVPADKIELAEGFKDLVITVSDPNFMRNLKDSVKSSLIGTGLDIAGNLGFGPMANFLVEKLENPAMRKMAWGQAIYSYAFSSDLEVMKMGIEKGGLNALRSLTSEPASHVLSLFKIDSNKFKKIEDNVTSLVDVLDKVDSTWAHWTNSDGIKIFKLDSFRKASDDAITALSSIKDYREIARSALLVEKAKYKDLLSSNFPILKDAFS